MESTAGSSNGGLVANLRPLFGHLEDWPLKVVCSK